ncbi:prenyltransferase/squalene oxidase repeat-containing protein [Micromonospora chersina]|uniref:prenyltransferase/squalene oxidase repeat-containing protein n=1 Tax=Micromonospora chersina TaxID=47854 RepID=UPI003673E0B3
MSSELVALADAVDIDAAAGDLISGLAERPWGQVGPSVYETGRLVSLAPWLTGHAERVAFLLHSQRADGGWGPPDGYALVPTLSATEALLAVVRAGGAGAAPVVADPATAAAGGLRALAGWLPAADLLVPDTPGVDVIVPSLVAAINDHLAESEATAAPALASWREVRLDLPVGLTDERLVRVRHALATGRELPAKLLHFLEALGPGARRAAGIRPVLPGTVGASPAATAAWLGGPPAAGDPARGHLEDVARGGPVPCPLPITVFEQAWVVSELSRAGARFVAPPAILESLTAALGPVGTPTGPGLPADADTTSVALYALGTLGRPADPRGLWTYETADGFCTWPGEDGFSVTTNAHVLDAFGHHVRSTRAAPRYVATVDRLTAVLREHQQPDGQWRDRWHASPYYATASCARALRDHGRGTSVAEAVAKAADWAVETQRPDGSWGRWDGTVEESAYALHTLLAAHPDARIDAAVRRGYAYLRSAVGRRPDPPLWYGKELYHPAAVVRAAVLAAFRLALHRQDRATAGGEAIMPIPPQRAGKS